MKTVPPCHHVPAILEAACLSTVMGQKMRDAVMLALEDRKVTLRKESRIIVDPGPRNTPIHPYFPSVILNTPIHLFMVNKNGP